MKKIYILPVFRSETRIILAVAKSYASRTLISSCKGRRKDRSSIAKEK